MEIVNEKVEKYLNHYYNCCHCCHSCRPLMSDISPVADKWHRLSTIDLQFWFSKIAIKFRKEYVFLSEYYRTLFVTIKKI